MLENAWDIPPSEATAHFQDLLHEHKEVGGPIMREPLSSLSCMLGCIEAKQHPECRNRVIHVPPAPACAGAGGGLW